MKVKIIRKDKSLPLPSYQTEGSVAFDIYSRVDTKIEPRTQALLPSNLIVEVPKGYVLLVALRSSTFKKFGLMMPHTAGIIDQDYHGPDDEIFVSVYNLKDEPASIVRGERIAQGLIIPIERAEWEEVESIKQVSRGGFGSTGNS